MSSSSGSAITFSEFKRRVAQINGRNFEGESFHPLDYGIERAGFEEKRLRQLIELAEEAPFQTAVNRKKSWMRRLKKVQQSRERFEQMKKEKLPRSASITKSLHAVDQTASDGDQLFTNSKTDNFGLRTKL
jgi:hypothetical protein